MLRKVVDRAVPGMFHIAAILELVTNELDECPFPEQYLVVRL